jgi:hypothetical protein
MQSFPAHHKSLYMEDRLQLQPAADSPFLGAAATSFESTLLVTHGIISAWKPNVQCRPSQLEHLNRISDKRGESRSSTLLRMTSFPSIRQPTFDRMNGETLGAMAGRLWELRLEPPLWARGSTTKISPPSQ